MNKKHAASARLSSSFILHPSSFRSGFTLTEILIVIALIVLIIAMAVPAFNLITGTRSVDAAENLVSAMLGQARATAIHDQRETGVAFFCDPRTDRTAMMFVSLATSQDDTTPEPQGMEQYKAWSAFEENGTTATKYKKGDVVYCLVNNTSAGRRTVVKFVCAQDHTSVSPTTVPPAQTSPLGTSSAYWNSQINSSDALDQLSGSEIQLLPTGVGAQLINDPSHDSATPSPNPDRYVRTGIIMFDSRGAIEHRPYSIPATDADLDGKPDNRLAALLNRVVLPPANIPAVASNPTYTQLGVVLYDLQTFRNLFGEDADKHDPINDGGANEDPNEELWLDGNGLNLLINRYNGTLIRGE